MVINEEMSHLELTLRELEKPMDYFWRTALYLREKELAARKRMEWLKNQLKVQEELRLKYSRGRIPPEVVDRVLSYIPTTNELICEDFQGTVFVDGLLHPAVYNTFALIPHFRKSFSRKWCLVDLGGQKVKLAVLEEESLRKHLKLRVKRRDTRGLNSLMKYTQQWKTVKIHVPRRSIGEVFNALEPCLPYLEKLDARCLVTSFTPVAPLPVFKNLKTVKLSFNFFPDIFNSGILNSITSLTLHAFSAVKISDGDVFKKALDDFPHMLSQLPCLSELTVQDRNARRSWR